MPPSLFSQVVELQQRAWSVALRAAVARRQPGPRRDRHLTWKLWEVSSGAERPGVYPEVSLGELVDADATMTIQSLPNQTYNVTELELLAVSALTRQIRARTAFEIGTADGRTTLNIANNAMPGGTVFTLNLPLNAAPMDRVSDNAGHNQGVPVGFNFRVGQQSRRSCSCGATVRRSIMRNTPADARSCSSTPTISSLG